MHGSIVFFLTAIALLAGPAQCQEVDEPLRLLESIPLSGLHDGTFDHFQVDLPGQRLFVAAESNSAIEVIDMRTNKLIHTIRDLHEPQGVTYAPDSNRIFVANGEDGNCRMFDGTTYKLLKTVHFSSDADDTRYDARTKHVFVGFGDEGNAGLGILDGATGELLQTIKLPDHPESFQLEKSGPRIFVNIPSAGNIIAVVDRNAGKIVATWTLDGAQDNFPMDLDEADHRLFIDCRTPPEVLVLDTDSGKIIARVPSVSHADDIWYDAEHKRIYVSGGEGFITVVGETDADHYRKIAQMKTLPGARTSFLAQELKRLYLGVWGQGSQPEELQIYETQP